MINEKLFTDPFYITTAPDKLATLIIMRLPYIEVSDLDVIKEGLLDGEKVGSGWRVKRYSIEKYLKPTRNNGQKID